MALSKVDLPAPFGPMMPTISPSPTTHVGLLHHRVGGYFVERALCQAPPLGQHDYVVAEARHHIHAVLNQ